MPPPDGERGSRILAQLHQLTDALCTAEGSAAACDVALDCLRRCLQAEGSAVLGTDPGGVGRFLAWRGLSPPVRAALQAAAPWQRCEDHAEALLIGDLASQSSTERHHEALRADDIAALARVPMIYRGQLVGELAACWNRPRRFSADEAHLLGSIANQLALALASGAAQRAPAADPPLDENERRTGADDPARRLAQLQREVRRLAQADSLNTVGDILVQHALTGTQAPWATLYQCGGDQLLQTVKRSESAPTPATLPVEAAHAAALAARTGTAVFLDGQGDNVGSVLQALAAVPVAGGTTTPAVLLVGFARGQPVPLEHRDFLQALCNQAGLALQRIAARSEAELARSHAAFLVRAGDLLASSLDCREILPAVARLAVPEIADWCVVELAEAEGDAAAHAISHVDPQKVARVQELQRRYPHDYWATPGVQQVLTSGQPELYPEITAAALAQSARDDDHLRMLRGLALHSAMVVPMNVRGRTIGTITLVSSQSDVSYDSADLEVAMSLAQRAALAVDNARLYLRAQRAVQARENLLAVVSHDLRNPLGVVRMVAATMLQSSPIDERRSGWRSHAQMLQRNAAQMERLIRDLLDFSRLESGMLSVSPAPCRLDDILDQAVETARVAAGGRGVEVERTGPAVDEMVVWDRERILQLLGNLLANGVQHSPEGGTVLLTATTEAEHVHVTVRDSGPGLGPQQLSHLFEPYWQAAQEQRARASGLGLGLFIAKGLVEAHNGRIWAESEPGVGSAFHVVLPASSASAPGSPMPANRSVLVIDDDPDFAREVSEILLEHGYPAVALCHGAQALGFLEQQPPPALIFLDLMMPEVGGWEILTALRAHPVLASVPVVIMTCLGNEGIERVLSDAAGYLQKPVQSAQLLQTAARFCGAPPEAMRLAQGD